MWGWDYWTKKKRTGWGRDFREIEETYRVLIMWLQNDCVNGGTRKWLAEEGQWGLGARRVFHLWNCHNKDHNFGG